MRRRFLWGADEEDEEESEEDDEDEDDDEELGVYLWSDRCLR
jgi:hypothetical protein